MALHVLSRISRETEDLIFGLTHRNPAGPGLILPTLPLFACRALKQIWPGISQCGRVRTDKVGQYIQLCDAIIEGSALDLHLPNCRLDLFLVVLAMTGNIFSVFTHDQYAPKFHGLLPAEMTAEYQTSALRSVTTGPSSKVLQINHSDLARWFQRPVSLVEARSIHKSCGSVVKHPRSAINMTEESPDGERAASTNAAIGPLFPSL
jgi:hypothetical protein